MKKKLYWVLPKESLVLTFNIVAQMKTNDFVRIFFQLVYNCIVSINFFNSPAHLESPRQNELIKPPIMQLWECYMA